MPQRGGRLPQRDKPWEVRLFKRHPDDDPSCASPAEELLTSGPPVPTADLFAILKAVAEAPPPNFRGGGMWEAMHRPMNGYFEARTRGPDRRLYRVFCLLEREAPGLNGPSIIVLCGMSKPAGTAFTDAEYEQVRVLGEEYRRRSPRSVI